MKTVWQVRHTLTNHPGFNLQAEQNEALSSCRACGIVDVKKRSDPTSASAGVGAGVMARIRKGWRDEPTQIFKEVAKVSSPLCVRVSVYVCMYVLCPLGAGTGYARLRVWVCLEVD